MVENIICSKSLIGKWGAQRVRAQVVFCVLLLPMLATAQVKESDKVRDQDIVDMLRYQESEDHDGRSAKTEILVSVSEEKAIKQLKRIIRMKKGTVVESDLQFRLAELYMRRSKTTRFFELAESSEGRGRSLKPAVVKNKTTRGYLQLAVNTYEELQRRFPGYYRMDAVLFNNAFAYQQLGRDAAAESKYLGVIRRFADSPLVADSHLAIGEMAFARQRYQSALEHFLAVKRYPNSRVYPYGMYKAAWAYYNLHNSGAAIRELEAVVQFGRKVESEGLDARLDLRREALADMTIFFEDVYAPGDAIGYLRKWEGDDGLGPSMLRLAALYQRHGKRKSERIVLRSFIAELQTSEVRPRAHDNLVWSFEADHQREDALRELQAMHDVCKPSGRWFGAQKEKLDHQLKQLKEEAKVASGVQVAQVKKAPEELPKMPACRELVDDTSLKLAAKWQRLWNKNDKVPLFSQVSKAAYEIYLSDKPEDDSVNQARFQFAELLFKRSEFRLASAQYASVGRTAKDSQLRHDAGYGALVSLEKAVNDVWSDADEKHFQDLAKLYVERNPKGKYVIDIEFKMAFIAYDKKRYEEAAPRLKNLGWAHLNNPRGVKAQDLYLDTLNIKKDYTSLKNSVADLRRKTKDSERQKVLTKLYQEAYFSEIQQSEEKGNLDEAIVEYKKFAKENSSSELAVGALWNVAQLYEKTNNHLAYAQSMFDFASQYPQDKRSKDALLLSAKRFQDLGELEKATTCLDKLTLVDSGNAVKWHRLSMEFNFVLGRKDLAHSHAEKARKLLKGKELEDFLKQLAETEEQFGDTKSHDQLIAELARLGYEPYRSRAQLAQIEGLFSKGRDSQAFALAMELVGSKSGETASRAKARLIQAQILEKEFRAQSVKAKVERIPLVLALKTEKLAKAQEAYQGSMKFGDPKVNVQALRKLSGCFEHYSVALRGIKLPDSVNADEAKAFMGEIESLLIPMEEKAVETMSQALQQAEKARLYDGTSTELRRELNRLNLRNEDVIHISVDEPEMVVPKFSGGAV